MFSHAVGSIRRKSDGDSMCSRYTRLCLKTPPSGPRASVFLPGKDGEAGDVVSIVDAAGCSQAENKPLEARWGF